MQNRRSVRRTHLIGTYTVFLISLRKENLSGRTLRRRKKVCYTDILSRTEMDSDYSDHEWKVTNTSIVSVTLKLYY